MYSSVPNRRVGRNKRAGGNILKKNIKRAGRNKRAGGKLRRPDIYKLQKKGQIHVSICVPNKKHHLELIMSTFWGTLVAMDFS